jgi:hypothetical protein
MLAEAAVASGMSRSRLALLLGLLFAFRLLFGLSREFFFEDETQIFLLGFRYHATGAWPFFGPDVVWTRSEIPGALQALLVGVPLSIAPIPEAPFVLLNVLSFAALAALAWYTCEQLPRSPRWLIWGWFLTIPWTLQFSTHIINPSYVLPAAVVFFIGFFESLPALSLRRLSPPMAHAFMGFALTWIMQIHMSWPLLVPYLLLAWWSRRSEGAAALARNAAACCGGALLPGVLLLPTLTRYGVHAGSGGVLRNLRPHWVSPWIIVTTLARFFSFASLEISRFIGTDGAKRLDFFARHLWLAPLAVVVWLVGLVQPVWMCVDWWRPARQWPQSMPRLPWMALRRLVAASVLLVYATYWFVVEPPQAHAFYVLAPLALVFAAFWWTFVDSPRARRVAAAVLALNVCFHAGLAWAEAPELSLYKNRPVVATAIRLNEPEMFAHRRDFAIGGGPSVLADRDRPYDPQRDIEVVDSTYRVGPRGSLRWTIAVRNRSTVAAFRDLLYVTTYLDDRGATIDERHERLKDIFEPGVTRTIEVNDGFSSQPFSTARLHIIAAEALKPAPGY